MQRMSVVAVLFVTTAWIAALAGCSGRLEPTSPARSSATPSVARDVQVGVPPDVARGGRAFYPLELGNRWRYRHHGEAWIVLPDGERRQVFSSDVRILRELTCVETIGGVDYVVERTTERTPTDTYAFWVRFRQDRSGLYEADVATTEPASCEAGGSSTAPERSRGIVEPTAPRPALITIDDPLHQPGLAAAIRTLEARLAAIHRTLGIDRSGTSTLGTTGELTRLRYPLRVGQNWVIRGDPLYTAEVEGHDVLRLDAGRLPGWRIRIGSELFGERDRVYVWYGRSGFLQLRAYLEIDLGTAGVVVATEAESLVAFDIRAAALQNPTPEVILP